MCVFSKPCRLLWLVHDYERFVPLEAPLFFSKTNNCVQQQNPTSRSSREVPACTCAVENIKRSSESYGQQMWAIDVVRMQSLFPASKTGTTETAFAPVTLDQLLENSKGPQYTRMVQAEGTLDNPICLDEETRPAGAAKAGRWANAGAKMWAHHAACVSHFRVPPNRRAGLCGG